MQKVNCSNCGKELLRIPSRINKINFCSRKCSGKYRIGERNHMFGKTLSAEHRLKISNANSGKKFSDEHRKKISESKLGNKNCQWKGDSVKIGPLHDYIKWYLPKPELCQCCGKVPPYDLANKGVYDRNLDNWEWLCRRCHMDKDGRLEEFLKHRANGRKKCTA